MPESSIKVNLHTHSTMSDGTLSPELLASRLADCDVAYASLTDHDTIKGSLAFGEVLARHGIGHIEGIELTVSTAIGEAHLLAYGFDIANPELLALLPQFSVTEARGERRMGPRTTGIPPIEEALAIVHAAGGAAFLAHPLHLTPSLERLETFLAGLKPQGIDGIEAIYSGYDEHDVARLLDLADRAGLAVSAGGDYHEPDAPTQSAVMEMPESRWIAFRNVLLSRSRGYAPGSGDSVDGHRAEVIRKHQQFKTPPSRDFVARIFFPAVTAVVLFIVSLFFLIIPKVEQSLLERKKGTIRELTESAGSILAFYEAKAANGTLSPERAKIEAAEHIRGLRYGDENKDYFWITDMEPRMIVHPYRADLEGEDLTDFRDEAGLAVFVEFVRAVTVKDEGYVEYLWQWKDDANRIVPKLSYVRRFAPWNWIIGTGIYIEDVREEIKTLSSYFIWVSILITLILTLIVSGMARQGFAIEHARLAAENALHESRERYRTLANGSTDGTVIVIGGVCTFANGAFLGMTGYLEKEIHLLRIFDLLLPYPGEEPFSYHLLESSGIAMLCGNSPIECRLAMRSGEKADVLVSGSPIALGNRQGAVLSVKLANPRLSIDSARTAGAGQSSSAQLFPVNGNRAAEAAGVGTFRTRWSRRAGFIEADPAAIRIFGLPENLASSSLFAYIRNLDEAERLYSDLATEGAVIRRLLTVGSSDFSLHDVFLSVFLTKDAEGNATRIEGVIEDASELLNEERRLEYLVSRIETESLWLSGDVSAIAKDIPSCKSGDSVIEAARRMKHHESGTILVSDESGNALGIVSSDDIVRRSLASGRDRESTIGAIMTSPIASIYSSASISDALALMVESRTDRIALLSPEEDIQGMAFASDIALLSAGSLKALRTEASQAGSIARIKDIADRTLDILRPLVAAGARPKYVLRALAEIQDEFAASLARIAMEKLGPPPAEWLFLSLGSMGREEAMPGSDQDNAFVWEHSGGDIELERKYFLSLASAICSGLTESGLPACPGGVMASNPAWNAPLHEWESRLERNIREPEPDRILDLKILLDFRMMAGSRKIADAMRGRVAELLSKEPGFFIFLARDERQRRALGGSLRSAHGINLKELSQTFSGFVRIYALKSAMHATNTFERLDALSHSGAIKPEIKTQIADAYEAVMSMRLVRCLTGRFDQIKASKPGSFTAREEALLAFAFEQAASVQKRIGVEFLGSGL